MKAFLAAFLRLFFLVLGSKRNVLYRLWTVSPVRPATPVRSLCPVTPVWSYADCFPRRKHNGPPEDPDAPALHMTSTGHSAFQMKFDNPSFPHYNVPQQYVPGGDVRGNW